MLCWTSADLGSTLCIKLAQAQETDSTRVYQIDLHAAHIGQINHLDQVRTPSTLDHTFLVHQIIIHYVGI